MVNDVRQIEIYTVVPLLPEPSAFKVQIATEKLQRHQSPGFDQILGELITAGDGIIVLRSIYLLILS